MNQATWDEECGEMEYRAESLKRWSMREQATANDCKCVGQFVCQQCEPSLIETGRRLIPACEAAKAERDAFYRRMFETHK